MAARANEIQSNSMGLNFTFTQALVSPNSLARVTQIGAHKSPAASGSPWLGKQRFPVQDQDAQQCRLLKSCQWKVSTRWPRKPKLQTPLTWQPSEAAESAIGQLASLSLKEARFCQN